MKKKQVYDTLIRNLQVGFLQFHTATKSRRQDFDLGPGWYIERLDTKIEKDDKVELKGSRVTLSGKPAIIAAGVKRGDSTLVLRDSAGSPRGRDGEGDTIFSGEVVCFSGRII